MGGVLKTWSVDYYRSQRGRTEGMGLGVFLCRVGLNSSECWWIFHHQDGWRWSTVCEIRSGDEVMVNDCWTASLVHRGEM